MKFYQIHVPKTGGSSLRAYANRHKLNWRSDEHIFFSRRHIPRGSIVVTALRCPVRHLISMYCYHGGQSHPEEGTPQWFAIHQPFSDWLRNPQGRLGEGDRLYTYVRFFGDGNFQTAVTNLKAVTHVLDTSYLTKQFNEKVVAKYNLPLFRVHHNKSPKPDNIHKIDPDDLHYIKQRRGEDFELCKMFGIETM